MARCLQLIVIWISTEELFVTFLAFFHQVTATSINVPDSGIHGPFVGSSFVHGRLNNNLKAPSAFNDGRLKLMLHAFINKLSEEMQNDPDTSLNQKQSEFLLHRLRGLYNHLRDHPALMDSRLAVGRPEEVVADIPADVDTATIEQIPQSNTFAHIRKRKFEMPLTEACPSVTEWLSLNKSRDIHDEEVEIFQPKSEPGGDEESQLGAQVGRPDRQFFYTTRCINGVENEPCVGASPTYTTRCVTRGPVRHEDIEHCMFADYQSYTGNAEHLISLLVERLCYGAGKEKTDRAFRLELDPGCRKLQLRCTQETLIPFQGCIVWHNLQARAKINSDS